jgi:ankyrin repeat protein
MSICNTLERTFGIKYSFQMIRSATLMFLLAPLLLAGCSPMIPGLHLAIEEDDSEGIEQIARGDKELLSAFPIRGDSPLLMAMHSSKKKAFVALLKNGADPNRIGPNHQCLLVNAAMANDPYWLTEVLRYGGDPNIDNMASPQKRGTPLTVAAANNRLESTKLLVESGADINQICDFKDALICAMQSNSFEVVIFLLENQADYRRKTSRYSSFAMWIRRKNADLFLLEEDKNGINRVWKWLNEHGATVENIKFDGDCWHW